MDKNLVGNMDNIMNILKINLRWDYLIVMIAFIS
jgi:hypothetical protein